MKKKKPKKREYTPEERVAREEYWAMHRKAKALAMELYLTTDEKGDSIYPIPKILAEVNTRLSASIDRASLMNWIRGGQWEAMRGLILKNSLARASEALEKYAQKDIEELYQSALFGLKMSTAYFKSKITLLPDGTNEIQLTEGGAIQLWREAGRIIMTLNEKQKPPEETTNNYTFIVNTTDKNIIEGLIEIQPEHNEPSN